MSSICGTPDWRARAAVESPSHLRAHPEPLRLTLLAALLHTREKEITDTLMDLLIATVHSIGARAEKRVTERGGCRLVPFLSSDGPSGIVGVPLGNSV